MKAPDQKASSRATPLRYLHGPWRHLRSNVVAYLALVVAIGGSGSYALAAVSASNGRSPSASTRAAGSCTSPSTSAAEVIRAALGLGRHSKHGRQSNQTET